MSSNTSAALSNTINVNKQTITNINMVNVTKLTPTNYLMWKLQVHALVDGYDLAGHLDGSTEIPSPTTLIDNVASPNLAYSLWRRQDKLIYSSLLGSITLSVQSTLSRTTTAAEIWSTLAATYAKPSRGHLKQLREQLKSWTQGSNTIDEYFQGLTTRFDTLASLGHPMPHEDQIELILEGLPDDYKQVVDQIEWRDVTPSITYVHERLLNQEAKLLSKAVATQLPVTANVVTQRNTNHNRGGQHYSKPRYNNNNTQAQSWQQPATNQKGPRPYLGRCQFCNVQGHSARRCPQIQNRFQGSTPQQADPFTPWQPRANLAMGSPYNADQWLLD